jgi:hypothetical protein
VLFAFTPSLVGPQKSRCVVPDFMRIKLLLDGFPGSIVVTFGKPAIHRPAPHARYSSFSRAEGRPLLMRRSRNHLSKPIGLLQRQDEPNSHSHGAAADTDALLKYPRSSPRPVAKTKFPRSNSPRGRGPKRCRSYRLTGTQTEYEKQGRNLGSNITPWTLCTTARRFQ